MSVFSEALDLKRLVASWRPDVVHLHSSKAGLIGRLVLHRAWPTVFQPHGWSFHAVGGVFRTAVVVWERIAAHWADAIVCVSDGELQLGEHSRLRGNLRVIPNGVDVSSYSQAPGDRAAARGRLGLDDKVTVVCVGRLSRAKGQDVLLAAWPAVVSRVPDARLVLVGEGPDRDALEKRVGPGVELVGHREDVPDWLAAADVVAMPSRWEGMSITMLEAMARGCCIVSTAVPGATELLHDGNGALVPVEDPVALAGPLIERLLDLDLREREGRAARRTVERSHDVRNTTQRMADLYAELVRERGR